MSRLDQLPEISEQMLSGLRADDALKHRIYRKAAGIADTPEKKPSRIPLAALCAISAVMIAVFALLIPFSRQNGNSLPGDQLSSSGSYESADFSSMSAGTVLLESPVKEQEEITPSPETDEGIESDDSENALPDQTEHQDTVTGTENK